MVRLEVADEVEVVDKVDEALGLVLGGGVHFVEVGFKLEELSLKQ